MQRVARSVAVPEDEVKQFVTRSPWEYEQVQQHLVESLPEDLASRKGAFIVDDVGIVKQGKHSVGAYRQYSGALGKVGNCQVAVNLIYSVPGGRLNADQKTWPLGTRLYVPKAWAEEEAFAELREEVHLPKKFRFQTKPEMAIDMIDQARKANIPHFVTLADAGYGDDGDFRRALRERDEPYIVGVNPSSLRVIDAKAPLIAPRKSGKPGAPSTRLRHDEKTKRESPRQIAKHVPEWEAVEWSEGTKGKLTGEFHRMRVRVTANGEATRYVTDEEAWLLLERRSNEIKAYLCWGLDNASLKDLVAYAHLRWTIEQFHRESKQILGFDRFEGRTWRGWHHHITMVLLAYAFLATLRATPSTRLPTIPAVAKALVIEKETQAYEIEGIPRAKARKLSEGAVRRLTDW